MRSVSSIFASSRRLVSLGLCLGLAACGSSQNWQDDNQFVTVGVSVTGFSGGSLALWNNGTDRLTIPGNGAFKFPLKIANGSNYAVVVATQPAGQTCTVANGIGTARGDVFERDRDLQALHLHAARPARDLQHRQGRSTTARTGPPRDPSTSRSPVT